MAVKGTELASAYVSLSFSTDKLPQQLRNITRNLKDVEVDVDADTKGATAHMEGWRATQQRRPVKIDVDVDTRRARKEVDALSSNLFKFGRSDFLRLNLGAAAISGLPALAAGLGEVTAAMVQLSQAALAIPGAIAGAASSFGTLALGVSGITDAYDALNAVQDEAATNGKQVAQQQRAQRSASFGLRNALVDHEQAQQDVNRAMRDARRDLQDLNLEMRGGIISEKRAVLEAQRARERLATGDYTDIRDALLDVEEADLRVAETRRRNIRTSEDLHEANVKGIEGSDQVVAANERLIRSEQGVVQAQDAVASAADTSTSAQEKAALAMSKLSPNAQEFVNTLMDLQGPFQSLKFLVQDNMFAGIAGGMSDLAGKSMPMLERGLGGIGKAWNRTFEEILNVAGTDETQTMLERIFGNTEEAQNILTEGIEPLVSGLGALTEAGTRALPRLADGFVGALERFDDFITAADEDGRLDEWINEGIDALSDLGETALNIGKIFTGIGDAAQGSLLDKLNEWTTTWANWVNSAEGQNTIQEIFREGRDIFNEWKPILEDIPGLFMGIYEGAKTYIGAVTDVVAPITEFLKEHPGLVEAAAQAYLFFKGAQVLGAIAELTTKLLGLKTIMAVDLPAAAKKGSIGISTAMSTIALPLWLSTLIEDKYPNFPIQDQPDGEDRLFPGWVPLLPFWEDQFRNWTGNDAPSSGGSPTQVGSDALGSGFFTGDVPTNSIYGGANASRQRRGLPSVQQTYGLPAGTDTGGYGTGTGDVFPPWVMAIADHFGIKPSTYAGHQETNRNEPGFAPNPNNLNRGIDWSGPVENMQRFADYVASIPGMEQVIWMNPSTGQKVGVAGGNRVGDGYYADAWGGHQNHVHTRQSMPIPMPRSFDTGGVWPNGVLGVNTTGQDEFVLNPQDLQWLQSQGIDPATLQHGSGNGTPVAPGPVAPPAPGRMEGYIPATAGNTKPVGQGGLSSILDLGESFFHNLIDSGAQLGSMAISAAAASGSFGAGAAAGPAASAGLQMGAEAAKRGVSYLYDLGGIWGEALVEQLFPFGAPRWLGSANPMAFMPQGLPMGEQKKAPGTMGAAKTAIAGWAEPGNPAMASMGNGSQGGQAALDAARAMPSYTPTAPQYGVQQPPPAAQPSQFDPMNPSSWLNFAGIFDQGGVWEPNSFGLNLSGKPEYVMTQAQMAGMAKTAGAGSSGRGGDTNNFYATDVEGAIREWQKNKRRQARQHSGRPF